MLVGKSTGAHLAGGRGRKISRNAELISNQSFAMPDPGRASGWARDCLFVRGIFTAIPKCGCDHRCSRPGYMLWFIPVFC